jgi:hypothetical protein
MDAPGRPDRSRTSMAAALKRTVAIGIVLGVIGYGLARMGGHSPTVGAQAAGAESAPVATTALRPASAENLILGEEDPRPCEPERGITERCTY